MLYSPVLPILKSLLSTIILEVKLPSSTSRAVTFDKISKSLFNFTEVTSSTFIVGFTLFVVNLGLAIIAWSYEFPFPES